MIQDRRTGHLTPPPLNPKKKSRVYVEGQQNNYTTSDPPPSPGSEGRNYLALYHFKI